MSLPTARSPSAFAACAAAAKREPQLAMAIEVHRPAEPENGGAGGAALGGQCAQ
jgi:hypothetical protein